MSIPTFSAAFLATAFTLSAGIANASMCSAPSNTTERAICTNPQLKQIEEVISKSYFDKHAELSPMEQQEIERDQKLWQSFLKNCKTDENCIRDAFNQRLTDIQDFNQVAEKAPSPDDNSETTVADNTSKTDLGSEGGTEASQTPLPSADAGSSDAGSAEKTAQNKQPAQDPSLITRFTSWLFPKKDTASNTSQGKGIATQQAVPEKPVSDMETASSDQTNPAPTKVMPSAQTPHADMGLPASGQETTDQDIAKKEEPETKPNTAKTNIAGLAKKVTAAKEFIPVSPAKPVSPKNTGSKNTGSKTGAGQVITAAAKTAPNIAASKGDATSKTQTAAETRTAAKEIDSPSFISKIKNFFSSSDPATSTQSPDKDIAKGTLGTDKKTVSPDLPENSEQNARLETKTALPSQNKAKQNKEHTDAPQQAVTDGAVTAHDTIAAAAPTRTGLAKTASRKSRKSRNQRARRAANARKRVLRKRKAQLRRRQAKRKLALRRAANKKRTVQRRKRIAVLKARKKQAAKRQKVAAAKKKAASQRRKRRLQLARTQKLRKNKRTRTAFALRSKNRKKAPKRIAANKKSAAINYAFPAQSLQGNSRYIKNNCNCSSHFKLEHHLREDY